MESEKVKEIKKALECCSQGKCEKCSIGKKDIRKCVDILLKDTLTLINELESENERLNKSEFESYQELDNASAQIHSLEEHIAEYLQENQQLKDRIAKLENIGLNENITVGEYLREMQRLKDRVAELEKEIEENAFYAKGYSQGIKNTYEVIIPEKLKQFAERLKEKIVSMKWAREDTNEKLIKQGVTIKVIEKTLKEFINETT